MFAPPTVFEIAETDLLLRGPGEFFGTRQSGDLGFHIANPLRDRELLELARREAFILAADSASTTPCSASSASSPPNGNAATTSPASADAFTRHWKGRGRHASKWSVNKSTIRILCSLTKN